MSTATAEPQIETVEAVTFMSRGTNQVLRRKSTRYVTDANGDKQILTEGEWQERQRELNESREANGEKAKPFDESIWKIEFEGNSFTTSDPVIIDWLRNHRWFKYNGPSGFWEIEKPIDEREPTVKEQMREIQQSSLHHDLLRAEVCLEVEQETHRRPVVLQAAEAAITDLRDLLGAGSAPDADSQTGEPHQSQPAN